MPTSALPRRAAVLAAGVTAALALTPAPIPAQPLDDPIEQQISTAEEQLEIIIEDHNDVREELRANTRRADELGVEMARLERELQQQRGELGMMLASAYRTSHSQSIVTVAALLDLASSEALVDSLTLITRLSREQHKVITKLAETRHRMLTARDTARQVAEEMRGQEQTLTNRKRQIEAELDRLTRMRDAVGDDDQGDFGSADLPPLPPGAAATAVRFAFAQLGKPYQWGGSGPGGYDCSGLTSAAWATAGVQLPHNAARQWGVVNRISRAERRPGDLVFYYRDLHHVAIYVGDGRIVHAPRPGKRIRLDRAEYQPIHSYGRPG